MTKKKIILAKGGKRAPLILAILDGFGIAPPGPANAVTLARTPNLEALRKRYPSSRLLTHGRYAGLLPDQEGNSEAGHMNIGAGRTVRQDIVTVTEAIRDRTFFRNPAFMEAVHHAKERKSKMHVMGMLSNGNSAHSSPDHLYAVLKLLDEQGVPGVLIHLFTDGRDAAPFSAIRLLDELFPHIMPGQRIATIMGRFYAMDRNKFWRRTEMAYNAIVLGQGIAAEDAKTAILRGYNRGESDEFILPTVMVDAKKRPIGMFGGNDAVIFINLRSDRARQLSKPFVQPDFEKRNDRSFARQYVAEHMRFTAMTDFGPDLPNMSTAFPSRDVRHGLTETLGTDFRQFYIAESEKYAHVTYFFNGGFKAVRFGEERMRVPSRFVPHHDSAPEMRASVMTDELIRRIKAGALDFAVINYANADMVAHTGNMQATVKAIEHLDSCLGRLAEAARAVGGHLVVTGDHGNAEVMIDPETGEVMTEHTGNPVPFILVSEKFRGAKVGEGMLADVAPTILDILDIPKPKAMTGFSLLRQ